MTRRRDGETTRKTTGNRLTEGPKRGRRGPRSGGDRSKQRDTLGLDRQPVTKARGYVCTRVCARRNARCQAADLPSERNNSKCSARRA